MDKSVLQLFDPYAMIQPKTDDDYKSILAEAIAIADDINRILDEVYAACEKDL